jgi:integrase
MASNEMGKVRPRRALAVDEVNQLITAVIEAEKHHGLTGLERSLVYRVALFTGLRYNEIYTLKRGDFTLGDEPRVTVQASNAKNRKTDTLPLKPHLAKELEKYFTANLALPHTEAFSGMWKDAGAKMLRPDLELAGIKYTTDEGVADFHSLRHTFGTRLAQSEVSPQVAQKLMRHSDINLTTNIYTHIPLTDKANGISKLPEIEIKKPKKVKTGTVNISEVPITKPSQNPIKIKRNSVKSNMMGFLRKEDIENISPCRKRNLNNKQKLRVLGLEPKTYGLKSRCSTN